MTPQEFVNKWANTVLNEIQVAQAHFLDVCLLAGIDMPGGAGKTARGETFVFEQSLSQAGGSGFAEGFFENHFGVEYKSPDKYKNLSAAYEQLQRYRENLKNPPLLVVTDINHWEIHTNFPNTEKRVYRFSHNEIASNSEVLGWLRAMFHAPERLHPGRNTDQVTKEAADAFQLIADNMRDWNAEPTRIAYFLTKLVFCLFAEDVGLLPTASSDSPQGIFSYIIQESRGKPNVFKQYVQNLFVAMNEGDNFLMREIPYFNGTLFKVLTVETLQVNALNELAKAAELNWASIEPSIFGTLFERSLDPAKRSQLGAHYTSRDDILLIVEPVLMQPLRAEWEAIQAEAAPIRERFDSAATVRARTSARKRLLALRERILKRVRETTVLDPACGSGNFLYVSLQLLMDLEKAIIQHSLWAGLQMATREVHPRQMYGIEINPIAQALASIVVWIGYIQWRINNGYGQEFGQPILEELEDNIVCKDAILSFDNEGSAIEPEWPAIDVIVGNPPFLGGKKQRRELGDDYIERLFAHYPQIHGEADLSTYWFEKSRQQLEGRQAKRAGLLSTNSIRGVRSRTVLERIKETGDIFMAWSDREWILDGAAVRVSMIGFDDGGESAKTLDGVVVNEINPDLTGTDYISAALSLKENRNISYMGLSPTGNFPISHDYAQNMLLADNKNIAVLRRYISGKDITSRDRLKWIVDFTGLDLPQAMKFERPIRYLIENVKPYRDNHRNEKLRQNWWLFEATRSGMINALSGISRQIMTSLTSKHRFFMWYPITARAANSVVAVARDDDYMFGVLHSNIHIVWALRKSGWLGKGNDPRYTNTTTFETFPFPWSPGQEDESHPAHSRISAVAQQLNAERDAWLNPEGLSEKQLKDRTLTNLYNALNVFRGRDSMKTKEAAADFAPRLDQLHRELDQAVCDAYGWDYDVLDDEGEILRRLLALNLARAAQSG
ncbi:MAG: class I SAM-dependent DNA methyltransferase [Chloroflexi bacterium]|nr:class I SAM-dependent DNA methyltransferase [Chloroflexota bacterium]